MRHWPWLLLLFAACSGPATRLDDGARLIDESPTPPRHTPRWAFMPWISKDISTTADTYDFVDGFETRDIPVGVVVIDSPWETNYHSFTPNPTRYPDFERLVSTLRSRDVRVVMWMTQFENQASFDVEVGGDVYKGPAPDFATGLRNGYYVNDGELYVWWKGQGAGVDFFNPEAVKWWHRLQDRVLELGISGWKLDFGDEYFTSDQLRTKAGVVSKQQYGEAYYRDMLASGVLKRGRDEFTTMSRPWDESYDFAGRFFATKETCPVGWVGDNRRDWVGLIDALDEIFRSAQAGYVVLGSDIGGYLDVDDHNLTGPKIPFSQTVFARWTALGALTPFMQLHGRGNFSPWTVPERPDETVALYRYWATLHTELVPFWYSLAEEAYAGALPIIRPVGATPAAWQNDWRYQLGEALLVAPLFDDSGVRDVALPAGTRWFDWWDPSGAPLAGGTTLPQVDSADRAHIPLYVREGAILPMDVRDARTGLGSSAHSGKLTLLTWPGADESHFRLHADPAVLDLGVRAGRLVFSALPTGAFVKLWSEGRPLSVSLDGHLLEHRADKAALDAAGTGWTEGEGHFVWLALPASQQEVVVNW